MDEHRIREIVVQELSREKPLMTAAIMSQVTPMFDEVNERVQEIHQQQTRMDAGLAGIYPRLDRQDKVLERMEGKLDRNAELVSTICSDNSRRDGADEAKRKFQERDKGVAKGLMGLVGGSGLLAAGRWIYVHLWGK